jgi:hypothetical protein
MCTFSFSILSPQDMLVKPVRLAMLQEAVIRAYEGEDSVATGKLPLSVIVEKESRQLVYCEKAIERASRFSFGYVSAGAGQTVVDDDGPIFISTPVG